MNSYSQDLRDRLIELYKIKKYSKLELAELFNLGYATVKRWCHRYEVTGSNKIPIPIRQGRRRLFDNKETVLAYLKSHPDADGIELHDNLAPHTSQSCFYVTLNRLGITYKKKR